MSSSDMEADEKRPMRSRRWWYAGASLALVLLLGGVAFMRVGSWLVVRDEPAPSAAIVVLSGEVPFRAMEGADLYNQGWAPEVWLTLNRDPRDEAAAAPLGVELFVDADDNRRILEAMGVPTDVIHVIPRAVRNTADEVREISKRLSQTGGERVIIVTSKFHTRRVRTLWRRLAGNSAGVIVQPATRDPYDGARWWRRSNDIAYVAKELMGLVNAWMGSRVQPW
ncbi:MAG: YdcF family protein [Gemmatimonadetes bacterium]|nr:YdcF family protein [Gemmatimonadota bacterium]